ncbi:MAG: energy transducer TonB, partial [Sediminibacterium sp.]
LENGVSGTVLLTFLVDEAGKIYTPTTVSKNIGSGLEQESVRLIRLMPTWNPGQIKGRNVKTRFTLPIKFELY